MAKPDLSPSEREVAADVNSAIAGTEGEIFADALGDDELDNDGDTSLEEMGDGLEGEQTDEGDEPDEDGDEPEAKADGAEQADDAEGDEDTDAEEQPQRGRAEARDERGRVPPGRLREEARRAREAEEREAQKDRQIAELAGRLNELSARVNAPRAEPKPEPKVEKPDMFADPDGYEAWVIAEAEKRADAKINQGFAAIQQREQQVFAQRLDQNLAEAASGPRRFEFTEAYRQLTALDPRDPNNQRFVGRILQSPDPAKAIFDWWDQNGADEFRQQVLEQFLPEDVRDQVLQRREAPRNARDGRQPSRQPAARQTPRHEVRLPKSLNAAEGRGSQRNNDPEMLDNSESSVFAFATR